MTDGDSGLSQTEETQWDAIVAREWPVESAILTTQPTSGSAQSGESDGTAEQRIVTVYRPKRPRLTPLAVGVLALAASAWLTIQILSPAYQAAGLAGMSRPERAAEVHSLTLAGGLTAFTLVVAASFFGVWAIATARYRLRRSSCRIVGSQSTPVTVYVHPPNPATAATWILLLFSASTAAGWWIPLQLGNTAVNSSDAVEALRLAAVGAVSWLSVLLLCAIGLTAWAAREARHRVRCDAARDDRSGDHALGSVAT